MQGDAKLRSPERMNRNSPGVKVKLSYVDLARDETEVDISCLNNID
jgi:hypothetical protein